MNIQQGLVSNAIAHSALKGDQMDTVQGNQQIDPYSIIEDIDQLVSLPDICIKVNEMVEDPNCSTNAVGTIISQDVNMTARLLKIANSAFYGFPSKIETISRAITIIGYRELRDLVLATAAIDAFDKIPMNLANMGSFWKHSVYCAVITKILATKCGALHGERLFITGLLHDIGHLIFYLKLPELAREAMVNAALNDRDSYIEERDLIGFDHAAAGGALLDKWGLPQSLVEPILFHHEPELAKEFLFEAAILHIANIITKNVELGNYSFSLDDIRFNQQAIKLTQVSEQMVQNVIAEARPRFSDALAILLPKVG